MTDEMREAQMRGAQRGGAATRAKQLANPRYQAKIAGVRAMHNEGYSIRAIAEHYEVSYNAMHRFMKTNNISTTPVLDEGDSSTATTGDKQ